LANDCPCIRLSTAHEIALLRRRAIRHQRSLSGSRPVDKSSRQVGDLIAPNLSPIGERSNASECGNKTLPRWKGFSAVPRRRLICAGMAIGADRHRSLGGHDLDCHCAGEIEAPSAVQTKNKTRPGNWRSRWRSPDAPPVRNIKSGRRGPHGGAWASSSPP
jgi:hypothetical protein